MAYLYKELDYSSKIRDIKGVQLSVLSPEEIKKRSVVHVKETILYDSNGEPVIGGLFDTRMGVIDHGKICPTDGLDNRFCPGYFGHIELERPVFHVQFLDIVIIVMKCICIRCSKFLCDLNDPEIVNAINKLSGKKLMNFMISKCSKITICGSHGTDENGCGALQPDKYIKDPKALCKIYAEWKGATFAEMANEDKKQLLTAEYVLKLFKRITDIECRAIGLKPEWCKPSWLICSIVPVPPPAVRPSVRQANGQRSEDDITHKLIDIIKTNAHLKKKIDAEGSLEATINEWTAVLQYHVATFVDNDLPNINPSSHRSGRPLKTLRERLRGKEGRIRGNLMGKRVDHCARSVISPDPNIKINELGVPYRIAMNSTFPEVVNKYNIARLYTYVRNGVFQHPGAKSVKRKMDNRTTSLQHVDTSTIVLQEGDIVNRHLIDGDVVLFNRQPSLHKMSMMAHHVKVMDCNTFRLNVSVTTPYNADFDGDEMNMHVPQSIQTRTELEYIAAVPLQIISPREHTPIITPIQDTLLGVNRLTNDGVYLTKIEIMNIFMYIESFDGILPEPELKNPSMWSGRQLLSLIIPKGINMNMKNNSHDSTDGDKLNHVIIENGQLIQGRIDKKIMSSGTRGIIHMIFNDYGWQEAQKFLDNLQNLITRYLVKTGFSVGISDLIADKETNIFIEKTIIQKKKDVSKIIQQLHSQTFDKGGSDTVATHFEQKINNVLNKAIAEAGKIGLKSLDANNRMTNMVSAGSKGKSINIAQMVACLGQQNVDGKRIPNGFNDRTLPHFSKYDISPESKGFVENSFIKGLSPQEFFFHAMGGREGLIDTAVKTSETGYIQRKLIKAMEDLKTFYDLSVRNASGGIVQFLYGEDGFNFCKIESQSLGLLKDTYETLETKYRFAKKENWSLFLNHATQKDLMNTQNYATILEDNFKQIYADYIFIRGKVFANYKDFNINAPINLFRLIHNAKMQFKISGTQQSNLNPIDIITEVDDLIANLYINKYDTCNPLFGILLRSYLAPKMLVKGHKLNRLAFDFIITSIKTQFNDSKIQPNEMVGPVAAQSIGEPATQMTLNTFHFAGVSEKSNVTRGVPRLKELLHLSKTLKAPSLTIFLNDGISDNKAQAQTVLNDIELTKLEDIMKSVRIYYDPDDANTNIAEDKELLQIYNVFSGMDDEINDTDCSSLWVIRFELDKEKMMNKDITMEQVYYKINLGYSNDISCIYTDDNSNKLIFRLRIPKQKKIDYDKINDLNYLKGVVRQLREKIIIKGVENINSAGMYKNKDKFVLRNKSYERIEEWVLDTNGINLIEILQHPSVDNTRTYSNDVYEMYETFGIEAARNIILMEIREVIDGAGSYVNFRHLSLLCDIMTNRGTLMSIDRFGINRGNIGPLAKCSFEETTDQLFKAAIFGELDKLNGVSANIMMGQIPPCGTGAIDILLDESKLINMHQEAKGTAPDIDTWEEKVDYCEENVGIDFDIEGIDATNTTDIPVVMIN
jgi:DNA-directed RNA polymerase II subunit RPB1